jgi:transposase-like protein
MPEENNPESNPTELAGPTRSAETAHALIRKTKRATRRRFPTEDKIRIVMEGYIAGLSRSVNPFSSRSLTYA